MTALIVAVTKQALADRKGVTALEYALIASAVAAGVLVAFTGLATKITNILGTVLP
ncbi:Flp family type IVb pilin [Siccirubricoccus sp. G192]|uniref:Flp family type IVb pilin n=1 Tax=Siccirubricoccus sp. G192 TaxID=2849651 RepID=UPI001C2C4FE1|nr:Flp family type IVb pilin [Siccirubricoccus sp. G192]MBV1798604.1 hypothetical protein [Siccirubricoccus sp. G192]